jgi:hypothetical protein
VVEQLIEVGRFCETVLELIPQSTRRSSARFQLSVANRGNDTMRVRIRGRDPSGAVRVECTPPHLTIFPGTFAHSGIRVWSTCRRWRGAALARPFQVVVDGACDDHLIAAGELVHHPILSYGSLP